MEPVATPAPVVATGCEQYRPIIARYGWDVRTAMAVMEAESGCDPKAYNPEYHRDQYGNIICQGSFGLMQISCHSGAVWDVEQNIAIAWKKYTSKDKNGNQLFWKPWGAYTSGKYLKFMRGENGTNKGGS